MDLVFRLGKVRKSINTFVYVEATILDENLFIGINTDVMNSTDKTTLRFKVHLSNNNYFRRDNPSTFHHSNVQDNVVRTSQIWIIKISHCVVSKS